MLRPPERSSRSWPARDGRHRDPLRRLTVLRWWIVGAWAALLVVRVVVVATSPHVDLAPFGVIEAAAIALGFGVLVVGFRRGQVLRRRHEDEALAMAIRRVDPTVWVVPAAPTAELRDAVRAVRPDVVLGDRVTWAFGATEASLWELDDRKATRVLVVRWSRVTHVALEDGADGRRGPGVVAIHYVRADDAMAVATFAVRAAPGSRRLLGRGPRLERIVADLAAERIVA